MGLLELVPAVLLIGDLGKDVNVHEFNTTLLDESIEQLREMWELATH